MINEQHVADGKLDTLFMMSWASGSEVQLICYTLKSYTLRLKFLGGLPNLSKRWQFQYVSILHVALILKQQKRLTGKTIKLFIPWKPVRCRVLSIFYSFWDSLEHLHFTNLITSNTLNEMTVTSSTLALFFIYILDKRSKTVKLF